MKNQLLAQGKMFWLSTTPVSKVEFKKLMNSGLIGDLFEILNPIRSNESDLYGHYQIPTIRYSIQCIGFASLCR